MPDEEVDLGWSEEEHDIPMEDTLFGFPGSSGFGERYVATQRPVTNTDGSQVSNTLVRFLLDTLSNKLRVCTLREMSEPNAEWMLDSRASRHFTHSIDDFVEYEALESTIPVIMATTETTIVGKGTVILTVDGRAVKIAPDYHIPDLKAHLMSLGQFLKSGLYSRGSACEITLEEREGSNFLTFYP